MTAVMPPISSADMASLRASSSTAVKVTMPSAVCCSSSQIRAYSFSLSSAACQRSSRSLAMVSALSPVSFST